MPKRIQAIFAAMFLVVSIFGVVKAVDATLATKADVSAVEDRWTDRFLKEFDRYPATLEELVAYMSPEAREVHRELTEELEALEAELKRKGDQ